MKKITAVLLTILSVVMLTAGCGGNAPAADSGAGADASAAEADSGAVASAEANSPADISAEASSAADASADASSGIDASADASSGANAGTEGYGHADKCLIIILDGFTSNYLGKLGPESSLADLSKNGVCCLTTHSTYPTHTCTNHATIMTGVGAADHGIVGNDRLGDDGKTMVKNVEAEFIQVPTLFEIASKQGKKTAMVSGKNNEVTLLSKGLDVGVSNKRPLDYLPDPPVLEDDHDNEEYFTYNMALADWVFESLFTVLETEDPDLTVVNIQSTDYIGHRFGPDSEEMGKCLEAVDKQLGNLRDKMNEAGMLENTAVFITADHGMTPTDKAIWLDKLCRNEFPGAGVVYDGRNGYIWLNDEDKQAVMDYFSEVEGVREVFERDSDKARELNVDFADGPDIFLEADTGYMFLPEPVLKYYRGQHGSQDDSDTLIPLIGFGAGLPSGSGLEQSDLRCVAPMVCQLMGIEPGDFDLAAPAILAEQDLSRFEG